MSHDNNEDTMSMYIMAIRVVEFSNEVYKIRKIFALKSTYISEGNY